MAQFVKKRKLNEAHSSVFRVNNLKTNKKAASQEISTRIAVVRMAERSKAPDSRMSVLPVMHGV